MLAACHRDSASPYPTATSKLLTLIAAVCANDGVSSVACVGNRERVWDVAGNGVLDLGRSARHGRVDAAYDLFHAGECHFGLARTCRLTGP